MDTIAKARELGRAIQQDDSYKAMMTANDACDACPDLQTSIEAFNELRGKLNMELMNEKKEPEKVAKMDEELKETYSKIMSTPEMTAFNEAKAAFSDMINFVNRIVSESANGANPDEIQKAEGCGSGGCSSCSGCH